MKTSNLTLLTLSSLLLVSCAGGPTVPSLTGTHQRKPVLTRASHPSGGAMTEVDGIYLGRRYYHPPGAKTGLAWVDVYGQH